MSKTNTNYDVWTEKYDRYETECRYNNLFLADTFGTRTMSDNSKTHFKIVCLKLSVKL